MRIIMQENEHRKLIASWCNGVSQAIFIAGFVTPFFVGILENDHTSVIAKTFTQFTMLETALYGILVLFLSAAPHYVGYIVLMNLEEE